MIAALKASVAAAYTLVALACPPAQVADSVELEFINKPPLLITDKTAAELGGYHIDTTFAKSRNEVFAVGGLHVSEFAPRYLLNFKLARLGSAVCLSADSVKIVVEYAPRIMIAKEHAPGSCRYQTILDHEMRHLGTDIITINEFLPRIREAMRAAVVRLPQMGPMPETSIDKAKDMLVDNVHQALVKEVGQFDLVRLNRQQLIDTRAEYLRVSKLCQ